MKIGIHIFLAIPHSIAPLNSVYVGCSAGFDLSTQKWKQKKKSKIVDFCAIKKHCNIEFLRKLFEVAFNLPEN